MVTVIMNLKSVICWKIQPDDPLTSPIMPIGLSLLNPLTYSYSKIEKETATVYAGDEKSAYIVVSSFLVFVGNDDFDLWNSETELLRSLARFLLSLRHRSRYSELSQDFFSLCQTTVDELPEMVFPASFQPNSALTKSYFKNYIVLVY